MLDDSLAIFRGGADSRQEESAVGGNVLASEQADRDLGAVAVKCAAKVVAMVIRQANDVAGCGVGGADIAAVDPEVAGAKPLGSSLTDDDVAFRHILPK